VPHLGRDAALHPLVGSEEEGGSGRRASSRRAQSAVDPHETTSATEPGGRLHPCFDRVEGEEGDVNRGASKSAGQQAALERGLLPRGHHVMIGTPMEPPLVPVAMLHR
jgi:hypothetical protein